MSTEQNKEIVRSFFERFSAGEFINGFLFLNLADQLREKGQTI